MLRWLFLALIFFSAPAHAMEMEQGADASTRTLQDYIEDYVDVPEGATDWKIFGQTKMLNIESKDKDGLDLQYYKPDFPDGLKKLDGKTVKVKGFMFPLDESEDQGHFLFGPFPLNCPFQYHVQPNLVVEVDARANPIPFSYEPVTLSGTLKLVPSDPENSTFYRLLGARAAR
jgi:hypothetical protein